ncbi:MAG: peptide ABC transporter substrate-binding protein [Clostridia bacterium]|nr:peptide ABC transporter substrate-binding protein [Clostridia bacterium]
MKKILVILLAVAMLVPALAGCSGTASGGEMIFNWNVGSSGPKTIDPGLNGASDGGDVINATFEGLVREIDGVIQPGVAKSWDISDDGKVYTFKLRKMNWSDGTKLTANDFVYAWKRAMDPATASEYQFIWEYTNVVGAFEAAYEDGSLDNVGIKAVDDYTFEVTLKAPTDYFLGLMAFYHFMPVKQSAVETGAADGVWAKNPATAVSNGPFKLESYTENDRLVLVKNEEYWNKKNIQITKINGFFIDDVSTAYTAYNSGELDFIPDVPPAEVPRLIVEDPEFYVFPLLGTYYYSFNLDKEMFQDVKVRKALALAIDREAICETLAAGQIPAGGFVPPGMPDNEGRDFFETAGLYGFVTDDSKVADAKALLAEAGYPGGEGFPKFTILYNTSAGHQLIAEMVQEMWKVNLGLDVDLANQEWAVFQDTRKEGNFDVARGGWLTDYGDPMGLLSIFTTNSIYNDPNYYNDEFDALMEKAANSNGAEHFDALYQAQDLFMNDVPIVPIYHYSDIMMAKPYLKGWGRSILGTLDFTNAYIER